MQKILMITILLLFYNNNCYAHEYVLFSICSDSSTEFSDDNNGAQAFFGHHSWLAITNLNHVPIKINSIEVLPFETITIGTWQGGIHNGIFYNVERYYYDKGEFSNEKSAYKMQLLNDFELNYLISILADISNDTWSITNNCTTFAEKVWNDIFEFVEPYKYSNLRISAGIIKTPIKLYENILKKGGRRGLIVASSRLDMYHGGKNPIKFEL